MAFMNQISLVPMRPNDGNDSHIKRTKTEKNAPVVLSKGVEKHENLRELKIKPFQVLVNIACKFCLFLRHCLQEVHQHCSNLGSCRIAFRVEEVAWLTAHQHRLEKTLNRIFSIDRKSVV